MSKELLFSQTKKDFIFESIKGSGPGGQHRNKRETGVRISHRASGATATATDSKSQETNKKEAFRKVCESIKFKIWWTKQVHEALGRESIESIVERQLEEAVTKYRIEGKWTYVD